MAPVETVANHLQLVLLICYSFRPIIAAKASCIQTDFHQAYHTSRINLNAWHTHSRTHTHTHNCQCLGSTLSEAVAAAKAASASCKLPVLLGQKFHKHNLVSDSLELSLHKLHMTAMHDSCACSSYLPLPLPLPLTLTLSRSLGLLHFAVSVCVDNFCLMRLKFALKSLRKYGRQPLTSTFASRQRQ